MLIRNKHCQGKSRTSWTNTYTSTGRDMSRPVDKPFLFPHNKNLWNTLRRHQRTSHNLRSKSICLRFRIGRHIFTDRSITNAIVSQVELRYVIREAATLSIFNSIVHSNVNTLKRAGNDVWMNVALVGVNADSIHVVLVSSVKRSNTAATGNLEDDIGLVLADLTLSNVCTLCCCLQVIRVVDEHTDTRVDLL